MTAMNQQNSKQQKNTISDYDRALSALQAIPADYQRAEWVGLLGAAKAAGLDDGDIEQWSASSDKYDPRNFKSTIKKISETGGATEASLYWHAMQNGWTDPRQQAGYTPPSAEETERKQQERAEQKAANEAARKEQERTEGEQAAKWASALYRAASPTSPDHPYLQRKGIAPTGTLRQIDAEQAAAILGYAPSAGGKPLAGVLLLAVGARTTGGICTAELIDGVPPLTEAERAQYEAEGKKTPSWRKTAIKGAGTRTGAFWATGKIEATATILIAEGIATTVSARDGSALGLGDGAGTVGIATFSNGNMPAVAQAMRQKYPAAKLVLCADVDKATGTVPDKNAVDAARLVGGYLAIPAFGANRPEGAKDFNDLHQLLGLEAVKACIDAAKLIEPEPAQEAAQIPSIEDCPCYRVFDNWVKDASGKATHKSGVWYFYAKDGRGDNPPTMMQRWICAPLYVEAVTKDKHGNNYGRLLRFKPSHDPWRTWAMPMELLKADGSETRGALLSMGLDIDLTERTYLSRYLVHKTPKKVLHCLQQTGWANAGFTEFALPSRVIGDGADGFVFQSVYHDPTSPAYITAGTLDGWREGVARLAVDNPVFVAGISAAFAGALLARCGQDGGGIHLDGGSSTGKSSIMDAACSVWGSSASYRRSWRTTDNGLEGIAAMFNDSLLALDEIGQADPKQVGSMLYALGNGRGKQRASRAGLARHVTQWRCFVLSNGEVSTATAIRSAGQQVRAGQLVRLLNIDVTRKHGAWDNLHGYETGKELADAIRATANEHHGHAGIAFLERLTRHHDDDFRKELDAITALPEFATDAKDGQAKRAAARLAVLALAGELATAYGITGWQQGAATQAAAVMFAAWKAGRGNTTANVEGAQIREAVAAFIDAHGSGRFEHLSATNPPLIHNRAGWIDASTGSTLYLFTAGAMREATKDFNLNRALSALLECGALQTKGGGVRSTVERIRGEARRVYPIDPARLLEV